MYLAISNLLQQILTITKLNQLFTSNISEEQQSARLTGNSIYPKSNVTICLQKHVKLTSLLTQKPRLRT